MPAYVIVMMTINDPDTYSKYTARTPAIIKKYGGKFLTRGEAVTTLEGTPYDGRMVIVEFPSKADVEAFYADPDYQEVSIGFFRDAYDVGAGRRWEYLEP